jgi:hypothetical protein
MRFSHTDVMSEGPVQEHGIVVVEKVEENSFDNENEGQSDEDKVESGKEDGDSDE